MSINVIVNGAFGKMGEATVAAVRQQEDMRIVATTGRNDDLAAKITHHTADVVVDMTHPDAVFNNCITILQKGAHAVVGTTGLTDANITALDTLAKKEKKSCINCPNFAIGAVLMMQFSKQAATYLSDAEIIEAHRKEKVDSPSGTALRTADLIAEGRSDALVQPSDVIPQEESQKARGYNYKGTPIHSVRLPGVIADQQVIFGELGGTLTLSHKTTSREAFMPGVILCIRQSMHRLGVVVGLEKVMGI
jgi:4-hydroxy-tetrahydrodipicolinate reductase